MPQTPHVKKHFTASERVRDIVIGMSDGLTVLIVMLLARLVFGYIKGRFTTDKPFRSAWQTVAVGGLSATAAFVIAKAIG